MKSIFDKTILLSGCISSGRDIASAMQMGADLAYLGTRFINTDEGKANAEYKQMIIDAGASDIVYTAAISGIPASFLRPSLEAMGVKEEDWSKSAKIDLGSELDAGKAEAIHGLHADGAGGGHLEGDAEGSSPDSIAVACHRYPVIV